MPSYLSHRANKQVRIRQISSLLYPPESQARQIAFVKVWQAITNLEESRRPFEQTVIAIGNTLQQNLSDREPTVAKGE